MPKSRTAAAFDSQSSATRKRLYDRLRLEPSGSLLRLLCKVEDCQKSAIDKRHSTPTFCPRTGWKQDPGLKQG